MRLQAPELILDPDIPIVDAHHHLWIQSDSTIASMADRPDATTRMLAQILRIRPRYLLEELMVDLTSGHNVVATIYVEANSMHRAHGPEDMRSVGEVEFANGVAAMAASGHFGEVKVCAGIVGSVDLRLDKDVGRVLRGHMGAGGERYRGVRSPVLYDEDGTILGIGAGAPGVLNDPRFRSGFQFLEPLGLSFDVLVLEPQLPDLLSLARDFPNTQIILNHVGTPVGLGRYTGTREERFPTWYRSMKALSDCDNVTVKLGGLGSPLGGFESFMRSPRNTSEELAKEWSPYITSCIELFGVNRCMFASNFPVDISVGPYEVVWNAFKRITAGASVAEKIALFSGTASRVYRLEL